MKIILFRFFVISFVSILFFVSCAKTNSKSENSSTQDAIRQARKLTASGDYRQAAKIYSSLAKQAKSPASDKLMLRVLDLQIKSGDYVKARKSAVNINPLSLNSRERVLHHLLYGKSEIKLGYQRSALKELDQISPGLLAEPEQQLYHILKVKAYEELGKGIESVQERIALGRLLDEGEEIAHNNRKISKTLAQMTPALLRHHRSTAPQTLRGWIDYTLIAQETLENSQERERYLQRWRDQYPGHTAIYSEVANKNRQPLQLQITNITNIAVILPHSGPYTAASHAIKQGMLTARDEHHAVSTPRIQFYDSIAEDMLTIYQRALDEGAEMIIGPLQKQMIQQLLESNSISTPVLALNQLDGVYQANLYQIGLNPKDEIEQVAALAWQEGHRRALVFVPETGSGERAGRLFTEYWESLGGTTLEMASYTSKTKELSKSVSALLNLDESMSRRRRVQSQLGKLEFTPRPRQDADMIFMMAKPTIARIIRPLLSFYRVDHLPVYSTSKVYSGKPDPSQDNDLSGVVFCGNHSQFDQNEQQIQQEVASEYEVAIRNIPLFNLGYDTYNMIFELSGLQQDPERRLQGKTGMLRLDSRNNIRRQLICGQFKQGYAEMLGPGLILDAENADLSPFEVNGQTHIEQQNGHDMPDKPWLERSDRLPGY